MNQPDGIRVDIWLWAARFFRTRSLAKQALLANKVSVNGHGAKPAKLVHGGDLLGITRGEERIELDVLALSDKRGDAVRAQSLYRETDASAAARQRERERHQRVGNGDGRPPSRPRKQARRLIRGFKQSLAR